MFPKSYFPKNYYNRYFGFAGGVLNKISQIPEALKSIFLNIQTKKIDLAQGKPIMLTFVRHQGNSLWVDIECAATAAIDPVWTNWTGKWEVLPQAGGAPVVSGTLIRTGTVGKFQLRVGPVSGGVPWTGLAVGTYKLSTVVSNTVVDYEHEEIDKLMILA